MAFQRALWVKSLTKNSAPAWPCPSCRKGSLQLRKDTLLFHETAESKQAHSEDWWEPEYIDLVFTCWLRCSLSTCQQDVAVSGVGGIEEYYVYDENGDPDTNYDEYFHPAFVRPMPDIFNIPEKCPKEIAEQLRGAFALFWQDEAAAASRVRVALEDLMGHLNVKKRRKEANGKIKTLTLHQRLEIYQSIDSVIAPQLMAVKWLGNTGSHTSAVTRDDLLDAFEILDHALAELIEQRSKKVIALAKKMTKRHRPRR
jgi:hypothetical protein